MPTLATTASVASSAANAPAANIEACQEQELAYEYRDGANAYGAFTFSLVRVLRDSRRRDAPTFTDLAKQTADRLQKLGYQQIPALVGPRPLLGKAIAVEEAAATAKMKAT